MKKKIVNMVLWVLGKLNYNIPPQTLQDLELLHHSSLTSRTALP